MRSGYVELNVGHFYRVGFAGYGWPRVSQAATRVYNLGVYPTDIGPSNTNDRWLGFPLRCSTIVQLPLAFVRSGVVNLAVGRSYVIGTYGYGWSQVSQSTASAYRLSMDPTDVYPSDSYYHWVGFPLHFTIVQFPLAFVRSGYVHLDHSRSYFVGAHIYGWSHVSLSITDAYYLRITSTDIYPLGTGDRWNGFPLRCLYNGNV